MAGTILTIGMRIGGLTTLVTMSNDLSCNGFTQTFVKHKIFSVEFILKSLFFNCIGVVDDTTFQMKNFLKSTMKQIGTRFFATDTSCTIHNNRSVLLFLQ